jgi:hypothetical protein
MVTPIESVLPTVSVIAESDTAPDEDLKASPKFELVIS